MVRVENYNNEEEYMRKSKRAFTLIPKSYDSLLNYLVDKGIIEIPRIKKHIFLNGVPDYYRFEDFATITKTQDMSQKIPCFQKYCTRLNRTRGDFI